MLTLEQAKQEHCERFRERVPGNVRYSAVLGCTSKKIIWDAKSILDLCLSPIDSDIDIEHLKTVDETIVYIITFKEIMSLQIDNTVNSKIVIEHLCKKFNINEINSVEFLGDYIEVKKALYRKFSIEYPQTSVVREMLQLITGEWGNSDERTDTAKI